VSGLALLVIGFFGAAAATDIADRRIPNWIAAGVAAGGLARLAAELAVGAGAGGAGLDLVLALTVFLGGALLFRLGLFGGGDVKLMAAAALWLGAASVGSFLFATALAGGALALLVLAGRLVIREADVSERGGSLPYGVAIATGGILATLGLV
jgi:prepilin peptidase CpaA